MSPSASAAPPRSVLLIGILCGAGAAFCWATGLVVARHGIAVGFGPSDLALHRYVWAGLALAPLVLGRSGADLGGIGWGRGAVLTLFGGPLLALLSYAGFLYVPLGHGGVIQPSCAALGGILLAWRVLGERLPPTRVFGAVAMVTGLVVLGAEAVATIGTQGLLGDLAFAVAGVAWSMFGTLLRLWRIAPTRAVGVVSVLALAYLPGHAAIVGFDGLLARGPWENLLQALVQGVFAGAVATYLFARSVVLLGAGRAAVFPTLVPGFTLLVGYFAIGNVPSLTQLAGLAIVAVGFRYAMKG